MLFNSLAFVIFFAVVVLLCKVTTRKYHNIILLIASHFFYGYWDWRFNLLLIASTVIDYFVGLAISNTESQPKRKRLLAVSIIANLGILGFFKYFDFFVESAGVVLHSVGLNPNLPFLSVILPVGISFYTFQTMSYTIEIYRRNQQPTKRFVDFALYVAFFPQLVAGPIERATSLLPQIQKERRITRENVLSGLTLMLIGFFKKIAIADSISHIVEMAFANVESSSSMSLLFGAIAFSIQIYGDFSGYSDIARGTSRVLGFDLMKNFEAPYLSETITAFWRRWHISLSSWLKDYLYIPLGGNRKGSVRTYVNLMVTMLLGGLWHGAAWNFVIWGFLHGSFLSIHKALNTNQVVRTEKNKFQEQATKIGKKIFIFTLVTLTWVFFRAESVTQAFEYLAKVFSFVGPAVVSFPVVVAVILMFALDAAQMYYKDHVWLLNKNIGALPKYLVAQFLALVTGLAAIAHLETVTPFIYFQF